MAGAMASQIPNNDWAFPKSFSDTTFVASERIPTAVTPVIKLTKTAEMRWTLSENLFTYKG